MVRMDRVCLARVRLLLEVGEEEQYVLCEDQAALFFFYFFFFRCVWLRALHNMSMVRLHGP